MSRRGALSVFLVAAFLLTAFVPLLSTVSLAASDKVDESMLIDIRLDGPDAVGINLTEKFTLRMSYAYPERIQNFSYTAGASGIGGGAVTPDNGSSASGVFQIEVKGAWKTGKMTVKINTTAIEVGGAIWYRQKEFEIEVVKPIFVQAFLVNEAFVETNNVTVSMLVDGDVKRTERYNMSAQQSIDLNFSWVFASMIEGEHIIKIVVDDPSNIVELSTGDNVLTLKVYYSSSGNYLRGMLAIMIVFVAVMLVLTYLQKKPGPKSK